MSYTIHLTPNDVSELAYRLVRNNIDLINTLPKAISIYGVPRGGVPTAFAVKAALETTHKVDVVSNPHDADIIVDDIIDSGKTRDRYLEEIPNKPFLALIEQPQDDLFGSPWYVFPWEESEEKSIEETFIRLLQYIGEDPSREGLIDTPSRMANAWREWTRGYSMRLDSFFTSFVDGSEQYDELVLMKNIPFYSHCEHHLAPFFGTVSLGYIPNRQIIGLSKLSRVVEMYSKRLQVQERLTTQIAQCLENALNPLGVGVFIKARHMCMESRGVQQQGHETVTCSLKGVFLNKPEARAEFLAAVQ